MLLTQKREELKAKRDEVRGVMDAAGDDLDHKSEAVTKAAGRSFEGGGQFVEYLNEGFAAIERIAKEAQDLEGIERGKTALKAAEDVVEGKLKHPGVTTKDGDPNDEMGIKGYTGADVAAYKGKTFGEAIVRHLLKVSDGNIANLPRGRDYEVDLPAKMLDDMILKTDMTTSAGWDPEDIRIARWIPDAQRPAPVVVQIFPTFPTTMSTILFMEETTFTNAAVEVAENTAISESALAYTQQSSEVRKIAHTLPVTVEQLEDVPGIRAIIDQRMGFMLQQRLDLQVLTGDGASPNLRGIHNVGSIGVQAKGNDSVVVAIHKAITVCQVSGFANPNHIVMHPNDWQTVRLSQTADGAFLFGPPSTVGAEQLWGLPVLRSTAETETDALVGDFANFCALYMRRGVTLSVTDSHASEFLDDIIRLKATLRVALVVFRPAAFTEVTGI